MTAREMRPEDVPHEYVMAAMKAAGLLHHDTARPALAAVLPLYRAALAEEFAAAVLADTAHIRYGSATDYAERHTALIRRMAAPTTTQEQCGRCNGSGIDPEHSSPGCTDPDRGVEPPTLEPCIACQYPKEEQP